MLTQHVRSSALLICLWTKEEILYIIYLYRKTKMVHEMKGNVCLQTMFTLSQKFVSRKFRQTENYRKIPQKVYVDINAKLELFFCEEEQLTA